MHNPVRLMVIGTLLMIMGVILPLLMVIEVLKSTFFLAFISYSVSLVGMVLAFMGLASIMTNKRNKK